MAALLELNILQHFSSIFVVIMLFAILYGVLEASQPFGKDKRGVHAILALFVALLFLVSAMATSVVSVMVPWFIILVVFLFFIMLLFRMFGVDDKQFAKVIKEGSTYPWIIIFSILVGMGAIAAVFGQPLLEAGSGGSTVVPANTTNQMGTIPSSGYDTTSTTTSSFTTNFINTLRNPKILGLVFVFLVGAFLMIFLTRPVNPPS